jgi:hypothetical protein
VKLVCNVNIVYGNLKSENSQDYAQKPQGNCTFMTSASVLIILVIFGDDQQRRNKDGAKRKERDVARNPIKKRGGPLITVSAKL